MRVIDHQPRILRFGDLGQQGQWRAIAVHREHAFGGDQHAAMLASRALEQRGDMRRIVVAKADDLGAAHPRTRPDTGMRQRIHQYQILVADQRRNDADISEIAGAEDAGGFAAFGLRELVFERAVERMIAGDEPRGAGTGAVITDRGDRRLAHGGMLAEIEVIVAGE